MQRYRFYGVVALAGALLVPASAFAQVVGSITGTVTDQTGMPLRGVKVSARSDTQTGGAKAVYTNDGGFIRDNVPGAADGGGVFAGQDWQARVRGANANQNSILVEGFFMNWQKITLNSLAAMEVLTAGNGAENAGTPGAVVNMVTQS